MASPKRTNSALPAVVELLKQLWQGLRALLALLASLRSKPGRNRKLRAWHLKLGKKSANIALSPSEVDRLLQRHRDLQDVGSLATFAARFRLPESDFFARPNHVERLMRYLLEQNPPWLHVSRVLAGGEPGQSTQGQETLWREQVTREIQEVTLFVPGETWRDLPLSSLTMRSAKGIHEVWQARLLDQILPPEVILDRCARGEILIPVRHNTKQRLDFDRVERKIEVEVRRRVPIPIDSEGDDGQGGQLLSILLDYSASMQGKSAVLAMAVITATLRANMGQKETRYLFRRFAVSEEIWPPVIEPPLQARTLEEKDALLETILATNFNGGATHVNDALEVAVKDIEHLRKTEKLEASVLLVTDGQAHILESTVLRIRKARVKVHTVMVLPQPNPELEALSESYTMLDISPDMQFDVKEGASSSPSLEPAPRRAYRI